MDARDFGWAIRMLKQGKRVYRENWNGKDLYIELQLPDANSANTLPYIYLTYPQGDRVPWAASQTDALATDWAEREP